MKNLLFLISGLSILQLSKAQLPDYYVYLTYGHITIQQNDTKFVNIKPKQLIFSKDIIIITDNNSEIELVDRNNNFIILNKKGLYNSNTLKKISIQKTEGLTKKYLRLVWEAIAHSSNDFEVYKNESVASSWGGGSRGPDCNIEKVPRQNTIFSNDSVVFKWRNASIRKSFKFSLYDSTENVIFELLLRDTQLILFSHSIPLGQYYWSAYSTSNPCVNLTRNKFTLITKQEENAKTDSIIKTIQKEKDPILYNLKISEALGSKGYIEKALKYFNKAWEFWK